MAFRKALTVWVLVVSAFLAILGTLHAWFLWQVEDLSIITLFSIPVEITLFFLAALLTTFSTIGAVCYVALSNGSMDLRFHKLTESFEDQLETNREDLKSATEESLAKLGLREFQKRDEIMSVQRNLAELRTELEQRLKSYGKHLGTTNKRLRQIERKIDELKTAQRNLPKLERGLEALKAVRDGLTGIQNSVEKMNSVPKPYVNSTDKIEMLEGSLLRQDTVQQLGQEGIRKVEDLLLKSPMELARTKAMSETEAKNLQGVIQLLMVPGVQLDDAVLLLKSGINSKQELAIQESLSLGTRLSQTAETYIKEGKIRKREKPTLEEIDSWIRWAKT